MKKYVSNIVLIIILFMALFALYNKLNNKVDIDLSWINIENKLFAKDWLLTDTTKSDINLSFILDWWPWKDWIPSINNPKFVNVDNTLWQIWLNDDTLWISVTIWDESKFYPYSILYWHEIVNDEIGDKKISVTFCPLCWTAIVYDRVLEWEELLFWVSWKLYESNLLMYDNKTESLWSQSIWKAVVWDYLKTELDLIQSDLMNFSEFKSNSPNWKVLSINTWFIRAYWVTPYWDYEENDEVYFFIQNKDDRLDKKELLYVINYSWESYAFVRNEIIKKWKIEYKVWNDLLDIEYKNWKIISKVWDEIIPWYIEMFFSWATQNENSSNIWWIEQTK